MNQYLWELEDFHPGKDTEIWDMFQGHPAEYIEAIRIRDAAISVGEELKRNPLIGKREIANYDLMDCIRRAQRIDNEKGDVEGIRIEWQEVGIADNCVQTLLRIQSLANTTQQVSEGKVV